MFNIELRTQHGIYKLWESIKVNLNLDTVASTFEFTGYVTKDNYKIFQLLKHIECEVWMINVEKNTSEKLITGYCCNPAVKITKSPNLATVSGYSRPGVLENACYPPKMYPLQKINTSLKQIALEVCEIFNLTLKIHDGAVGACNDNFNIVRCGEPQSIKSFLSEIGYIKGVTIAHDNEGNLFLYRILDIIKASSVIDMSSYVFDVNLSANIQGMHSECTAIMEMDEESDVNDEESESDTDEKKLSIATVKSPFITDIFIPKTIKVRNPRKKSRRQKSYETEDGETTTLKEDFKELTLAEHAEKELCQEARNFPIIVNKIGWDFDGRIVRAGFYLDLEYEDRENLMLKIEKTKFLVNSNTFTINAKQEPVQTLECVLPCVYTHKLPSKSPFIYID